MWRTFVGRAVRGIHGDVPVGPLMAHTVDDQIRSIRAANAFGKRLARPAQPSGYSGPTGGTGSGHGVRAGDAGVKGQTVMTMVDNAVYFAGPRTDNPKNLDEMYEVLRLSDG